MKPLYPRPEYIPADFVFVGRGKDFEHIVGEDYYYVAKEDFFKECRRSHKAQLTARESWREDCDFYARRPKKVMREEKKVKYRISGPEMDTDFPWTVSGLEDIAKCKTREIARNIVRALNK